MTMTYEQERELDRLVGSYFLTADGAFLDLIDDLCRDAGYDERKIAQDRNGRVCDMEFYSRAETAALGDELIRRSERTNCEGVCDE
jgi:hypothetical protein